MARRRDANYLNGVSKQTISAVTLQVAEKDTRLREYYVGRERYVDRALQLSDPSMFFIGPKGAGKSAILQMVRLERQADEARIINISPDDLAFSALANVQATTPLLEDAGRLHWVFKSLWDYVLALELLKREYGGPAAVLAPLLAIFKGRNEREARTFLTRSLDDGGSVHTLSERMLQLVREIELSGEAHGVRLAGTVKLGAQAQGEQLALLSMVNSVARNLPTLLHHQYHVLIDDLDLNWMDTPLQNAFLASLFTSLVKLRNGDNLKFVVALRQRIFQSLPLDDKDKIRDWVCSVEWDAPLLREMVELRIASIIRCQPREVWGGVLPENSFNVMWERTTGQPREMIRLLSNCISEAIRNGHRRVEEGDIGTAIVRYSREKIEDLGSELQYKYRGVDALVRRLSGWPKDFDVDRIHELAIAIAYEVQGAKPTAMKYSWAGVYGDDPLGLARVLLETQVLRLKQSRTAAPKEYDPEVHHELRRDMWYSVHPMYAAGLGCVGER